MLTKCQALCQALSFHQLTTAPFTSPLLVSSGAMNGIRICPPDPYYSSQRAVHTCLTGTTVRLCFLSGWTPAGAAPDGIDSLCFSILFSHHLRVLTMEQRPSLRVLPNFEEVTAALVCLFIPALGHSLTSASPAYPVYFVPLFLILQVKFCCRSWGRRITTRHTSAIPLSPWRCSLGQSPNSAHPFWLWSFLLWSFHFPLLLPPICQETKLPRNAVLHFQSFIVYLQ